MGEERFINEVIGTLMYDSEHRCLVGKTKFTFEQTTYQISLRIVPFKQGEGFEGLSQKLLNYVTNCISTLQSRQEYLLSEMFRYYDEEIREEYENCDVEYKEIHTVGELLQMLTPKEVYFFGGDKTGIYGGFYCEWNWNYEGFGIRMDEDGNIMEMGTGEVIY